MTELKKITVAEIKERMKTLFRNGKEKIAGLRTYPYREKWRQIKQSVKKFRLKKSAPAKFIKKAGKWISSSWKILLATVPSFLFFYYLIGSNVVENMDVETGYVLPSEKTSKSETVNSMAFLIRREIDGKMWTPNLPIIFPAYALDNMPNFQIGIIEAVRDMTAVVRRFQYNSEQQVKDAKEAYELLRYPPHIWLLSRKGSFGIAPSSNAQYRKARKELLRFNQDGDFVPTVTDLEQMLAKMSRELQKLVRLNEEYQQEHDEDTFASKADDLFYHHRGYAFAQGQISKALGVDFKEIILEKEAYMEWTFLISSLKKAAEFKPVFIRNGKPNNLFAPNHLLIQNYYLLRALTAAQRIQTLLQREKNAN